MTSKQPTYCNLYLAPNVGHIPFITIYWYTRTHARTHTHAHTHARTYTWAYLLQGPWVMKS